MSKDRSRSACQPIFEITNFTSRGFFIRVASASRPRLICRVRRSDYAVPRHGARRAADRWLRDTIRAKRFQTAPGTTDQLPSNPAIEFLRRSCFRRRSILNQRLKTEGHNRWPQAVQAFSDFVEEEWRSNATLAVKKSNDEVLRLPTRKTRSHAFHGIRCGTRIQRCLRKQESPSRLRRRNSAIQILRRTHPPRHE
jgi:hypothetical protein